VRNGLMLLVTFNQFGVQDIEEIPIWLETDRRTCKASGGETVLKPEG